MNLRGNGMADKTKVHELAKSWNMSASELLEHFRAANMRVTGEDQEVSSNQQTKIKTFLEEKKLLPSMKSKTITSKKMVVPHKLTLDKPEGSQPETVTLKRKTRGTLKVTGSQSRSAKTVSVEVRKKRTYVQRRVLDKARGKEEQKELEAIQPDQPKKKIDDLVPEDVEATVEKIGAVEPKTIVEKQEIAVKDDKKPTLKMADDLGIDKNIVQTNLEREKRLRELMAKEKEEEEFRTKKKSNVRGGEKTKRVRRKVNLRSVVLDDDEDLTNDLAESALYGTRHKAKVKRQVFEKPVEPMVREIAIPEVISVMELAQKMAVKVTEVIKFLMNLGVLVTANQTIDRDTAILVVEEMGHKPKLIQENIAEEELLKELESDAPSLPRAPIVTVMGHVDHGKTMLLDSIRKTKVVEKEAGGITQHIGAYHIETGKGAITFLDTPGHEAFTAMRARGAKLTDIVVLVVAADDGVMPQTIEAIQHAKAAEVPIVVAINKIDKPEADPERVKTELSNYEVISEEWGGDTIFVKISAKEGTGIDELLSAILLQAEVLELKAPESAPASGIVIESRLDKNKGPIASVLVLRGTLHVGDVLLAGVEFGHVRFMKNEQGVKVIKAGPSMPVEVFGLSGTPNAGDDFIYVADERKARNVALARKTKIKEKAQMVKPIKLEELFDNLKKEERPVLNLILKTDVQGSLEALKESLLKLSTDEVQVKLVSSGVGGITESDVNLALASRAIIVAFNVRADLSARTLIESSGLDVRYYSVIYNAVDEIKSALSGLLAPDIQEKVLGLAEVREVFRSSKFGTIAGCMVINGIVKRNKPIRLLRDNVVIYEGILDSLRHFKDDVNEVKQGKECGLGIKGYDDLKAGDQIEVFDRIEVKRTL
jgi:translation initiation factor IF-2